MNQPTHNSTLNAEARSHLLESVAAGYTAHDSLQSDDKRTALIEIDKVIAHAHEARKFLLGKNQTAAVVEAVTDAQKQNHTQELRLD